LERLYVEVIFVELCLFLTFLGVSLQGPIRPIYIAGILSEVFAEEKKRQQKKCMSVSILYNEQNNVLQLVLK